MGLLTELFIDDEVGAKSYDAESAANVEGAQLGGLTALEFETLWAILEGDDWDPEKHALPAVSVGEESWTHQFPAAYVEKLHQLDSSAITSAAAAWAATEEVSATPEEMSPVIEQLVALARSARKQGKGLFVWTSL
jgi:hypothetical protein